MKNRINEIEVLRAFAVSSVVIHHAHGNLYTWSTPNLELFYRYFGGWIGVDLFFAISGFVIARGLLPQLVQTHEKHNQLRTVVAFWIRRFWRLQPSAWLWLFIIMALTIGFNRSGAFGTINANIGASISAMLNVANFHFAETFGSASGSNASFHYWSLSLEEQFYIVLPVLTLALRNRLIYLFGVIVIWQLITPRTLVGMIIRTDALALGVIIAIWSSSGSYRQLKPDFIKAYRWFPPLLTLAVITILSILGSDSVHIVSFKVSLIALLSAMLVWMASYDENLIWKDGISLPVLRWIGSRSYAIYLIHIPAFFACRELWFRLNPETPFSDADFLKFTLTSLVFILLLSEANYRCIEMPLRKRGARFAKSFETRTP